jgi:hypothetical protein
VNAVCKHTGRTAFQASLVAGAAMMGKRSYVACATQAFADTIRNMLKTLSQRDGWDMSLVTIEVSGRQLKGNQAAELRLGDEV